MAAIAALLSALALTPVHCVGVADFNALAGEQQGTVWAYGVAGLIEHRTGEISLTTATCRGLAGLRNRGGRRYVTLPQAISAFTLTHEIGHRLYGWDEVQADEYGLAHVSALAYELGVRRRIDFQILRDYVHAYAPLHATP